jgi:hypothetical protein
MGAGSEDSAKGKTKNRKKEVFLNIYYLFNIITALVV